MKKTNRIEEILMVMIIALVLPIMVFTVPVLCIFACFGIIAGVVATAIGMFVVGIMFGVELIDVLG